MADVNRKAPRLGNTLFSYTGERTIVDAEKIYVGEMVQQDDTSLEVEAATAVSGKTVLGVSTKEVDNTDDGKTLNFIETSVLGMDKVGVITEANIGDLAYVEDAASVSVSGSVNVAGRIADVDDDFVWVDFDPAKKN